MSGYSDVQIDKIEHDNNGHLPQYHPDFVKIPPDNPPQKDPNEEEVLPSMIPPNTDPKPEDSFVMTQLQHTTTNEQPDWSILSEVISYHSCPSDELDISPAKSSSPPLVADEPPPDSAGDSSFFVPYDGVHCKLHDPSTYNNLTDVSTTYLGPVEYNPNLPFSKEASVSIDPCCLGKAALPTGEKLNVLFDTGA